MSHTYTLSQQENLSKCFEQWNLPFYFSKPVMNHMVHIVDGMLSSGFTGTLTDIHRESLHHRDRRSLSHVLSHGKWNEQFLKQTVHRVACAEIQKKSEKNDRPIFVVLDDTVCEKTKPSSQANVFIEGASYHHSHLKGKNVYGHAVVKMMLRTGDLVYPFCIERYDPKGKSKIELACDMIEQVPVFKQKTFILMDSWYTSETVLDTSAKQGFHVIGGLKTNRIIYPKGIRQSLTSFASHITKSDTDVVTIQNNRYSIYRYEGSLNAIENAVVLLCWKDGEALDPKSMRALLTTDIALTNEQILTYYASRWAIETYVRAAKVNLAFDRYQVRSAKALDRYFALLLFVSMCCVYSGSGKLINGLHQYRYQKTCCWIEYIYEQAQSGAPLSEIKKQLRVA